MLKVLNSGIAKSLIRFEKQFERFKQCIIQQETIENVNKLFENITHRQDNHGILYAVNVSKVCVPSNFLFSGSSSTSTKLLIFLSNWKLSTTQMPLTIRTLGGATVVLQEDVKGDTQQLAKKKKKKQKLFLT